MKIKKVQKLFSDGTTEYQAQLVEIQQANDIVAHSLTLDEYTGLALQVTILTYPKMNMVTKETNSAEHLALFAKASTCSKLFRLMLLVI
jgi:hypothetical protein